MVFVVITASPYLRSQAESTKILLVYELFLALVKLVTKAPTTPAVSAGAAECRIMTTLLSPLFLQATNRCRTSTSTHFELVTL